jgi:hypothetical protein
MLRIMRSVLPRRDEMGTYQNAAEKILSAVIDGYAKCQEALVDTGWTSSKIDEMGLLVDDHEEALSLISQSVSLPVCQLFNYAEDRVSTAPVPGSYSVQYWFLSMPRGNFRVEVMNVATGSPIHDALRRATSIFPLAVHASFKCADEEQYAQAHTQLLRAGWERWQRCNSSYGRFSYYGNSDLSLGWLLKPRLNLRDESVAEDR